MTRTVRRTKVHYATISVVDGAQIIENNTTIINEQNTEKAIEIAKKSLGNIFITSTEPIEEKFYIDDEIFFGPVVEVEG